MPKSDKIATVQIIAWLIILAGIIFTAGQSFATLNIVKDAIAEIKPEVIKHGKEFQQSKQS